MTIDISQVENNIFLNIADDSTIKNASDQSAEFYNEHCKNKQPLSQINLAELNLEEAELTRKYGIYWIKENFHLMLLSHITTIILSL